MQKLLAFVFAFVMVIGFALVYYVEAEFNDDTEDIVLFSSDTNANFLTITETSSSVWDERTTGLYSVIGSSYFTYDKSPVYIGNDTWTISSNVTTDSSFIQYMMELPDMDNWIMKNITLNITIPDDTDLTLFVYVYSGISENVVSATDGETQVFLDYGLSAPTNEYYNRTIDLSLAESVDLYDKAQSGVQHYIGIIIKDANLDGFDNAFSFNMRCEIVGENVETFSLNDTIVMVLIISVSMKLVTMLYMTDSIDIGGMFNDIPDKRR